MTTEDTGSLISQWGRDPAPPILADSWGRRPDSLGQERAIKVALKNRPDLGWAFAERLVSAHRSCSLLKRPQFRWIRAAVWLRTGEGTIDRRIRDVEVVSRALDLHQSATVRPILNAALATREATAPAVAEAFRIQRDVIDAYADLFFNVLDRKDDVIFLQCIMGGGKSDAFFVSKSSLPSHEDSLLVAGFEGTISDVLKIAGMARGDEDESDDELMKRVKWSVLKAGVKALDAPRAPKQRSQC